MNRGYEIVKTWRGCELRRKNQYGKYEYLYKVYKGRYEWISDYTYAKQMSEATCRKHIQALESQSR